MNFVLISGTYCGDHEHFFPARDGKNAMLLFQICVRDGRNRYSFIDCRAFAETAESMHKHLADRRPAVEVVGRTTRQEDTAKNWRQFVTVDSWRYAPTSKDAGETNYWNDDIDDT